MLDRADAPELSAEGLAQLETMLDLLHAAGVFAPARPSAEHLAEAMADQGEPVTLQSLPAALEEAVAWWPEFDLSRYTRNLAFHAEHGEQFEEVLAAQIDDLARLSGGALDVLELGMGPWLDGVRTVPVRLRVQVGGQAGAEVRIDEAFWGKSLNLPLFQRLAAALRSVGAPRRLAGLYGEQGLWITSFAGEVDLAALNHALGVSGEVDADEGWCWLDEMPTAPAG